MTGFIILTVAGITTFTVVGITLAAVAIKKASGYMEDWK